MGFCRLARPRFIASAQRLRTIKNGPIGPVCHHRNTAKQDGISRGLIAKYLIAATSVIDNISTLATIVAKPTTKTNCHPLAYLTADQPLVARRLPLNPQRQGHGGGDRLRGRHGAKIREKKYYHDVLAFEPFEAYCKAKYPFGMMEGE